MLCDLLVLALGVRQKREIDLTGVVCSLVGVGWLASGERPKDEVAEVVCSLLGVG